MTESTDDSATNPYASPQLCELQADKNSVQFGPLTEPIHIAGALTPEQFRRAHLAINGLDSQDFLSLFVVSLLMWLPVTAAIILGSQWIILPFGAVCAWLWIRKLSKRAKLLRGLNAQLPANDNLQVRLVINDQGIFNDAPKLAAGILWSQLTNYHRDRQFDMLVLYQPGAAVAIFPRSFFASETDWRRFNRAIAFHLRGIQP